MNLSTKSQKTLEALSKKVENSKNRMPSISRIALLLTEAGIKNSMMNSVNVVESRSGQNTYVNDRHEGKAGKELIVYQVDENGKRVEVLSLDSSNSYYSWNSFRYAFDLLKLLNK